MSIRLVEIDDDGNTRSTRSQTFRIVPRIHEKVILKGPNGDYLVYEVVDIHYCPDISEREITLFIVYTGTPKNVINRIKRMLM
ncbi:MAG: hypothetical protein KI791_13555 [Cyclobacteriaceae bacterium]|nr:hypothetical protein [Cyclobacteriaceae bacterium SS2]